MLNICGRIRAIYPKERIFEIMIKKKINFFYLSRSQMKRFNAYLQEGLFVHFICSDETKLRGHLKAYDVITFTKMIQVVGSKRTTFFDIDTIRRGVQKVLDRPGNRMFLDFEFSMPPYEYNPEFISEIIEYGLIIEDFDGQVIYSDQSLIKPKNDIGLNQRTLTFINNEFEDFNKAIPYHDFYENFKYCLDKYHPIIYVWGKNDMSMLDASYVINKKAPLTQRKDFVNLMQIIKNYYNMKTDIGLFNALNLFNEKIDFEQRHDAMSDAEVTSLVYHLFKKHINSKE